MSIETCWRGSNCRGDSLTHSQDGFLSLKQATVDSFCASMPSALRTPFLTDRLFSLQCLCNLSKGGLQEPVDNLSGLKGEIAPWCPVTAVCLVREAWLAADLSDSSSGSQAAGTSLSSITYRIRPVLKAHCHRRHPSRGSPQVTKKEPTWFRQKDSSEQ